MSTLSPRELAQLAGGQWTQETACGALVGATAGLALMGCPAAVVPGFWALLVC